MCLVIMILSGELGLFVLVFIAKFSINFMSVMCCQRPWLKYKHIYLPGFVRRVAIINVRSTCNEVLKCIGCYSYWVNIVHNGVLQFH